MSKILMDKGWDDMKSRLDSEMPTPQRSKRTVLFFWLSIGFLSGVGGYYFTGMDAKNGANDGTKPIPIISTTAPSVVDVIKIGHNIDAAIVNTQSELNDNNSLINIKKSAKGLLTNSLEQDNKIVHDTPVTLTKTNTSFDKDIKSNEVVSRFDKANELDPKYTFATDPIPAKFDGGASSVRNDIRQILTPDLHFAPPSIVTFAALNMDNTNQSPNEEQLQLAFLPRIETQVLESSGIQKLSYPEFVISDHDHHSTVGAYLGLGRSFGLNDMQTFRMGLFVNQNISPKFSLRFGTGLGYVPTNLSAMIGNDALNEIKNTSIENFNGTAIDLQVNNIVTANVDAKALYRLASKWSLVGGLEIVRVLDYKWSQTEQNHFVSASEADLKSAIFNLVDQRILNNWDVLPLLGVQFHLSKTMSLEWSYSHGTAAIFNQNTIAFDAQKRREFRLLGNFTF